MIFRRHNLVALLLMAAVVSLAFSPLLAPMSAAGRHHPRTSFALTASLILIQPISTFFSHSSSAPETHATRSQNLIELHCVRLC
jgi:hypothetical protein